ncbi:MAG: Adenine phosphoribosyltransferase [uncultured Thermomicrobiales bacterium]|uniref:Adenine phosphoribosyltransferase n=1 Tax=uncultured Thermomicrobiales bacterium TaxID=1645740 RepID=A0A6J4U3E6_9BACT|nr:MAG: Adenine phosphoribosyltransferase [uncultured Thermomicrobiales bacterium]
MSDPQPAATPPGADPRDPVPAPRVDPALDARLREHAEAIRAKIRDIPDFPQPGILFRDITPLLADGAAFQGLVDAVTERYRGQIDAVVAIESRGFIFGAPLAYALGVGLVPVRKAGKLPDRTLREEYTLEYGTATLEIHHDAVHHGERVLLVDDLLATGGTVRAAANLVERLGGEIAGVFVLAELSALGGRDRLAAYDVTTLVVY